MQLFGRRWHAGGERPQQRPVPVHADAGLRQRIVVIWEPHEQPGPFRRRREPPVRRPVGALFPAASVAALLLPLRCKSWGQPLLPRAYPVTCFCCGSSYFAYVGVHVRIALDVLGHKMLQRPIVCGLDSVMFPCTLVQDSFMVEPRCK